MCNYLLLILHSIFNISTSLWYFVDGCKLQLFEFYFELINIFCSESQPRHFPTHNEFKFPIGSIYISQISCVFSGFGLVPSDGTPEASLQVIGKW